MLAENSSSVLTHVFCRSETQVCCWAPCSGSHKPKTTVSAGLHQFPELGVAGRARSHTVRVEAPTFLLTGGRTSCPLGAVLRS